MNKKSILIVVLLIVLAGFLYFYKSYKELNDAASTKITSPRPLISRQQVPTGQLPDKFPRNIPIEKGAKIAENYSVNADGRYQGTVVFETAKSIDVNVKIYLDYLAANKWTVTSDIKQEGARDITATKGELNLKIRIAENSITNVKTVGLYLTLLSK